jgi:hypothetical protein
MLSLAGRRVGPPVDPAMRKPVPVALYNCTICNHSTPLAERHVCQGLTAKQRRRLDAWKRLSAYRHRVAEMPVPCPDCLVPQARRSFHACPGRVDHAAALAAQADLAGIVGALQRAGLKVSRADDGTGP